MAKNLTLKRVFLEDGGLELAVKGYRVFDEKERTVGFLVAKPKELGEGQRWGYSFVESELKSGITYLYSNRTQALDALLLARSLQTKAAGVKVIKSV